MEPISNNEIDKDNGLVKFSGRNTKYLPKVLISPAYSWIKHLNCPGNNLEEIDILPPNLVSLVCDNNKIKRFFCKIPPSLESISANNNKLINLDLFDSNVKILRIRNNGLKILECSKNMEILDISYNNKPFVILPIDSLITLIASNCNYDKFTFSESIKNLQFSGNNISEIDDLPKNLSHLNLSGNKLKNVYNWPSSLISLNISGNKITKINGLPNLKELTCSANSLETINIKSPNLNKIICYNNPHLSMITVESKSKVTIKNERLKRGDIIISPLISVYNILESSLEKKEMINFVYAKILSYYIEKDKDKDSLAIKITI
jgi:hypothetical protein